MIGQVRTSGVRTSVAGAGLALLLLAAACSTTPAPVRPAPGVGMEMILPPAARRMTVPDDKVFLMAAIVENPLPAYPPAMLDRDVDALSVCAEIVVGEAGNVVQVTPLYGIPECPGSQADTPAAFVQSVATALGQWQFFAAAICSFPPGVPVNDACEGAGVDIDPVAIKLAYVFEFRNDHGAAVVESRPRPAR